MEVHDNLFFLGNSYTDISSPELWRKTVKYFPQHMTATSWIFFLVFMITQKLDRYFFALHKIIFPILKMNFETSNVVMQKPHSNPDLCNLEFSKKSGKDFIKGHLVIFGIHVVQFSICSWRKWIFHVEQPSCFCYQHLLSWFGWLRQLQLMQVSA